MPISISKSAPAEPQGSSTAAPHADKPAPDAAAAQGSLPLVSEQIMNMREGVPWRAPADRDLQQSICPC
jgi:hypothetical protein